MKFQGELMEYVCLGFLIVKYVCVCCRMSMAKPNRHSQKVFIIASAHRRKSEVDNFPTHV